MPDASLPWDALGHAEGDVPWPALETFADALAADAGLWERLRALYSGRGPHSGGRYEILYVPAIAAIAAPRLGVGTRDRIARLFVGELVEASEDDDTALSGALLAASGALGPAVLPHVLHAIDRLADWRGAWPYLWRLTAVAASCEEPGVRAPVAERCLRLLRRVEAGEVAPDLAAPAAWTLARMRWPEAQALLLRLFERTGDRQISDALALYEGRLAMGPDPEPWELPVRQWLVPAWEAERAMYVSPDEPGDDEEIPPEILRETGLAARFMESQREEWPEEASPVVFRVPQELLDLARTRCHMGPESLDLPTLRQVLLKHFPRDVVGDEGFFAQVIPVAQRFLRWLGGQGVLPGAEALADAIAPWHDELVAYASDPSDWSYLKLRALSAALAPLDEDEPEAEDVLTADKGLADEEFADEADAPRPELPEWLGPSSVRSPKAVGRNDPCPCGSGRKYKKCCGR